MIKWSQSHFKKGSRTLKATILKVLEHTNNVCSTSFSNSVKRYHNKTKPTNKNAVALVRSKLPSIIFWLFQTIVFKHIIRYLTADRKPRNHKSFKFSFFGFWVFFISFQISCGVYHTSWHENRTVGSSTNLCLQTKMFVKLKLAVKLKTISEPI